MLNLGMDKRYQAPCRHLLKRTVADQISAWGSIGSISKSAIPSAKVYLPKP
jgi:hypothetical protein